MSDKRIGRPRLPPSKDEGIQRSRNQARAWRWRQKNLTPDERAEHNEMVKKAAAKRRWDTRGRLPPGEAQRRHRLRTAAIQKRMAEQRREYMRAYYLAHREAFRRYARESARRQRAKLRVISLDRLHDVYGLDLPA